MTLDVISPSFHRAGEEAMSLVVFPGRTVVGGPSHKRLLTHIWRPAVSLSKKLLSSLTKAVRTHMLCCSFVSSTYSVAFRLWSIRFTIWKCVRSGFLFLRVGNKTLHFLKVYSKSLMEEFSFCRSLNFSQDSNST